jgi:hypothetical protein
MATPAAARLPIQTRSEAGSLLADCDRSRAASQMNNASAPNQTKVARAQAIASFLSTLSPSLDGNRTLPRPAGSGGDSSAAERSEPPSNVQLSAVGEVRLSPPDLQWRHLARTASAPKSTACKILGSPARLQQFFLSYGRRGGPRVGNRRCASRSSPMSMLRRSTGRIPFETSTLGIRPSTSRRVRLCTWRPRTGSQFGEC